jgi:cell division protein FtsX
MNIEELRLISQTVLTTATTQIISGALIGLGIGFGLYLTMKNVLPKLINQIIKEVTINNNIKEARRTFSK